MLYVKQRRLLKAKLSKPKNQAPRPPAAPSVPSLQPAPRSDLESRLDTLASQVLALSELFQSRIAAPQAFDGSLPASQALLRVGRPLPPSCRDSWSHPGVTGSGRLGHEAC